MAATTIWGLATGSQGSLLTAASRTETLNAPSTNTTMRLEDRWLGLGGCLGALLVGVYLVGWLYGWLFLWFVVCMVSCLYGWLFV